MSFDDGWAAGVAAAPLVGERLLKQGEQIAARACPQAL